MNCKYCQAEVFVVDNDDSNIEKQLVDRWRCHECASFMATNKDGLLISTSWSVQLGDHLYFIKAYDGCTGNAPTFIISYYTTNPGGIYYWEEVKRFNFIPRDWTPLNSAHKLKTYLPFL